MGKRNVATPEFIAEKGEALYDAVLKELGGEAGGLGAQILETIAYAIEAQAHIREMQATIADSSKAHQTNLAVLRLIHNTSKKALEDNNETS